MNHCHCFVQGCATPAVAEINSPLETHRGKLPVCREHLLRRGSGRPSGPEVQVGSDGVVSNRLKVSPTAKPCDEKAAASYYSLGARIDVPPRQMERPSRPTGRVAFAIPVVRRDEMETKPSLTEAEEWLHGLARCKGDAERLWILTNLNEEECLPPRAARSGGCPVNDCLERGNRRTVRML